MTAEESLESDGSCNLSRSRALVRPACRAVLRRLRDIDAARECALERVVWPERLGRWRELRGSWRDRPVYRREADSSTDFDAFREVCWERAGERQSDELLGGVAKGVRFEDGDLDRPPAVHEQVT